MEKERSSTTAEGVALVRAIETRRPKDRRVVDDPIAPMLVNGASAFFSKLVIDSGIYGRMAPGAIEFIITRERYIDDLLGAYLSEGLDQVVILGAGFDTRAYRIPGIEKTRVFEVDQPATQAVKHRRLKNAIGPLPDHVAFVPVDFNTQTLAERLLANGYDERGKTLFIWQGVTYFLTTEGVDNTLAFVAEHSGPGSGVVFDYFYAETLRDSSRRDVKLLRRTAQLTGEEYMFGIDEGQVESYLVRRGFHAISNVTLEDLKPLYLTGPNAGRVVPKGIAIVAATVNSAGE